MRSATSSKANKSRLSTQSYSPSRQALRMTRKAPSIRYKGVILAGSTADVPAKGGTPPRIRRAPTVTSVTARPSWSTTA
eukprot:scaffold7007_cov146-Amphora_coffeaeformis.AAC.4